MVATQSLALSTVKGTYFRHCDRVAVRARQSESEDARCGKDGLAGRVVGLWRAALHGATLGVSERDGTVRDGAATRGSLTGGRTMGDYQRIEKAAAVREARDVVSRPRGWTADAELVNGALMRYLAANEYREQVEEKRRNAHGADPSEAEHGAGTSL
jgi:hypothetical protein